MRFYSLLDPRLLTEYAEFSHVGTWSEGELCPQCERPTSRLTEPLQIEWEPDFDRIGDVSWCGYTAVVTAEVAAKLKEHGFEVAFGKVQVMPPTTPKRRRKMVSYPYEGPALRWLRPKERIQLDTERSDVPLVIDCPLCKQKDYKFKRRGLVILSAHWGGQKLFKIQQLEPSAIMFVSEEGRSLLEDMALTNIVFEEAGEIG